MEEGYEEDHAEAHWKAQDIAEFDLDDLVNVVANDDLLNIVVDAVELLQII